MGDKGSKEIQVKTNLVSPHTDGSLVPWERMTDTKIK